MMKTEIKITLRAIYGYSELDNPTPERDGHPKHIEAIAFGSTAAAESYAQSIMPLGERIHRIDICSDGKRVSSVKNPGSRRLDAALNQKL